MYAAWDHLLWICQRGMADIAFPEAQIELINAKSRVGCIEQASKLRGRCVRQGCTGENICVKVKVHWSLAAVYEVFVLFFRSRLIARPSTKFALEFVDQRF